MRKIFKLVFMSYPKLSASCIALILLTVLLDLPMPLLTVYFIDNVITGKRIDLLNLVGLVLVILLFAQNGINLLKNYLTTLLYERITMKFGIDAFHNFMKSNYLYHVSKPSGYWVSRIQNEPQSLAGVFRTTIDMFTTLVTFVVGVVLIFAFNYNLGLFTIILIPFYVFSLMKMNPQMKTLNNKVKEEKSKLMGFIEESLNGFEVIKLLTLESFRHNELKSKWENVIQINIKWTLFASISAIVSSIIVSLAPIGVLWYGGYLVIIGQMSLGKVIGINKFLSYVFRPINSMVAINTQIQDILVSVNRLEEISQNVVEYSTNKKIDINDSAEIDIRGLTYSYLDVPVLNDLNISIEGGKTTAIIGESGCGKSTLLRLLTRMLTPNRGSIYIDNQDISEIDVANLRNQICLIPQNAYLFSGNFTYNIALGEDENKLTEDVLKSAGLDRVFKEQMENGNYDIGARGQKVSGGQRQRISLARALIRDPKILMMDEVTSEIDLSTETEIINNLIENRKGKTTIIVAHRLSSIIRADTIIYMTRDGIYKGTHDYLLHTCSEYYKLWNINTGVVTNS